ncbi:MAG: 5-formyltetrahydrofolate cyclo-ligase [Bacteroidaceae bacterium]|nr:5-formyltetrahydrofolate cyclo-ligase [Bacteroidaceae bacterium]
MLADKRELRAFMRQQKAGYNVEEREQMADKACQTLLSDGLWRSAGVVVLYHALPDEVSTRRLLDNARLMGKRVLLPKVVGDDLELREYVDEHSLEPGPFGILEPVGKAFPQEQYSTVDLVVVPGMAFDAYGNRLGRGKGYYDRLLPRLQRAYKMGICFPFQMVEQLPCEEHDIRMDEVIWK